MHWFDIFSYPAYKIESDSIELHDEYHKRDKFRPICVCSNSGLYYPMLSRIQVDAAILERKIPAIDDFYYTLQTDPLHTTTSNARSVD